MDTEIVGIDLGTTNSSLAVMRGGRPEVVLIDGQATVPSVVSRDADSGEFIVGNRARNRQVLYPELTVASIKRLMGTKQTVSLGSTTLKPEDVSAEILRYLKIQGEQTLGSPIRRAVVTVPANFDDAQRRATAAAGESAGLEVVRLLNEPTAAALVYGLLQEREDDFFARSGDAKGFPGLGSDRVLVYDLGGGTFDVSVVQVRGELYEVAASRGDTKLGGDDFDRLLLNIVTSESKLGVLGGTPEGRRALTRLRFAVEEAKKQLSGQPYARIMEEALLSGVHVDLELSRDQLEDAIRELLERTVQEALRALEEARLGPDRINRVLLAGGSTRIPMVARMLEEGMGVAVSRALDPDLCVALGAAVQGAIIAGETTRSILVDVAAHSLGVRTADNINRAAGFGLVEMEADHFVPVIPRNSPIPVVRSEVFYTVVPNQKAATIAVFQGESARCSENTLIGSFDFDLKPAPEDSPVVVEYSYDLDGIIHVVVEQKGHANRREVTMIRSGAETVENADPPNGSSPATAPDNLILRKADRLRERLPAGPEWDELTSAADAYALALAAAPDGVGPMVDEAEDLLLEVMERIEDTLHGG